MFKIPTYAIDKVDIDKQLSNKHRLWSHELAEKRGVVIQFLCLPKKLRVKLR